MLVTQLRALNDNYIFVIQNDNFHENKNVLIVDPGISETVLDYLADNKLKVWGILTTHYHSDHTGGIREILTYFPQAKVFGGIHEKNRIPLQTHFLDDNDIIQTPLGEFKTLFIPGHTFGHIAYYFSHGFSNLPNLFSGDTLFGATCGNIFEGSIKQMQNSLAKIRALPHETSVFCAHEYTLMGVEFAAKIEKENPEIISRLEKVKLLHKKNTPTVPLILKEEVNTNPYLRWDAKYFQDLFQTKDDVDAFTKIISMS